VSPACDTRAPTFTTLAMARIGEMLVSTVSIWASISSGTA
jgi:hypothetical protein